MNENLGIGRRMVILNAIKNLEKDIDQADFSRRKNSYMFYIYLVGVLQQVAWCRFISRKGRICTHL